jgi:amidase
MPNEEIIWSDATQLAAKIARRDLSSREVVQAHLEQIEAVNPTLNAIVTLDAEGAMVAAAAADDKMANGAEVGPLHGLPVAYKDLHNTKGMRTTMGSPLLENNIPDFNTLIVDRMESAGAIRVGKTNTPEWGLGSQTFNPVFGATKNPYDLTKTCGGSSGGAAVALAAGMIPLADGSDMGGSLRNPASFCNVAGFRPSGGRVPVWPSGFGWSDFGIHGPMARTVGDLALLMTAITGADRRVPNSLPGSPSSFGRDLERDLEGVRIAWSPRLGDLPVAPEVVAVMEANRSVFESLGCEVVDADPDLTGADDVFQKIRAWEYELGLGELLDQHPEAFKDTAKWNIEQGRSLSGPQVGAAQKKRTDIFRSFSDFLTEFEFLVCPVSQVAPFPIETEFISEIEGVQMETYIDWMKSCCRITVTGHPALSVPAGFTPGGLPVGVQIVGRHLDDFGVLQFAHAFEQANPVGRQRPNL